ncbi:MAG TPA: DUF2189 domain-containing protein, partial [Gemmatimonadales bacterium]|nr:DUF2189 domain-containing protein [Gemmatimonadales bacterium]
MPPDTSTDLSPAPAPAGIRLRPLRFADIGRWLALGWRDFTRAPAIGIFYGGCFALMGWALLSAFEHAPVYVLALAAGFLLVGPFMCMGLYRVSQHLERGEAADFEDSLIAWNTRTGSLAVFGFALLVIEMIWSRVALVIFAVSFDGMPDFKGSILRLLDARNLKFIVAYVAVGGVFAAVIFAVSVVSIPMILDRRADAITAG